MYASTASVARRAFRHLVVRKAAPDQSYDLLVPPRECLMVDGGVEQTRTNTQPGGRAPDIRVLQISERRCLDQVAQLLLGLEGNPRALQCGQDEEAWRRSGDWLDGIQS